MALLLPALVLAVALRRLLFQGLIPLDGNLLTLSYPHWALTREFLLSGTLPLWNPFYDLGEPYLADPQTMALYPGFWLLAPLARFAPFLALWTVLHGALAGGAAWRWARESWNDDAAAATAALGVACSGTLLARVTFPNHFAAAAWIVPALYLHARGRWTALGVALALQWLAGFPPLSVLTVLALAAQRAERKLAWACLLGAALAAAQAVPFLEMLLRSERGTTLGAAAAAQYSTDVPYLLKALFLPQWYALRPATPGDPAMLTFYLGPAALALALWALRRGAQVERRLGAAAGVCLLLSLGWIPFPLFRFPAHWLIPASLALSALAARGVTFLPKGRARWAAAALLALDLAAFAQPPKTAWVEEPFLRIVPQWARGLEGRVYHTPLLRARWEAGALQAAEDFVEMQEYLAPSYAAALGLREVRSYQVLGSRAARAYERRLAAQGPGSPLLRWAGIEAVVTDTPGGPHVLRRRPGTPRAFAPDGGAILSAELGAGRADITARLERPGRVMLNEAAAPGWRASVDGEPVEVETFERTFLAVSVPAGEHRVDFRYRPRTFPLGLLLSGAGLGFLAVCGLRRGRDTIPA